MEGATKKVGRPFVIRFPFPIVPTARTELPDIMYAAITIIVYQVIPPRV